MRIINTSPFSPDKMLRRMLDEGIIDNRDADSTYGDLIDMDLDNRKKLYKFIWPQERINT